MHVRTHACVSVCDFSFLMLSHVWAWLLLDAKLYISLMLIMPRVNSAISVRRWPGLAEVPGDSPVLTYEPST